MTNDIQVVSLARLESVFDKQAILASVRDAYISHADGHVVSPPPGSCCLTIPGETATSNSDM